MNTNHLIDIKIGLLLWKTSNLWQSKLRNVLEEYNLTLNEFIILETLLMTKDENITQVYISKSSGINVSVISTVIKILQKKSLIKRKSGLDSRIGGYIPYDFDITGSGLETIFIPNYEDFCMTDEVYCYSENGLLIREGQNEELIPKYLDLPHDGQQEWDQVPVIDPISGEVTGYEYEINLNTSDDSNDNGETFAYYDVVIDEGSEYEYSFKDSGYGEYNPYGNEEKGSGDNRSFSDELEEMIYNVGLEWWYTENFAMRLGFIYDIQGDIKNPTFGAGIKFNKYAFDFGYTSGPSGHPRANTMFFSLSLGL